MLGFREQMSGLERLRMHLGWRQTLNVVRRIVTQQLRGAPFHQLPPPPSARERANRDQAGGAVLTYEALLDAGIPQPRALEIAADVVEAGALIFLHRSIGVLDRAVLTAMPDEARRKWLEATGRRFPNADLIWRRTDADAIDFEIKACRLVQLVAEVGRPELAPMFCAADKRFFGEVHEGIALIRPQTLAGGDPHCIFHLRWR